MVRKILLLVLAAGAATALAMTFQSRHEISRYREMTKM
jgi:hypothetical protein